MSIFSEWKLVLGILLKNQYSFLRKKAVKDEINPELSLDNKSSFFKGKKNLTNNKKTAKIVGLVFVVIYFLGIMIGGIFSVSKGIVENGLSVEFITIIMGISQFVVLFFGLFTSVNVLFYSKDSELLSSLPISDKSIFLARFSVIYINEVLIASLFCIPMLLCFGITISLSGLIVPLIYWFLIPLTVLLPILPLMVISILIIPLFYVVSFFKRRKQLSGIFTGILFFLIIGLYFVIYYFSFKSGSAIEEGALLSAGMVTMLRTVAKILYFDLVLAKAMMGINAVINLLIFFAILIGAFILALLFASFFYPKAKNSALETNSDITSNNKKISLDKESFFKTFLIKEWKTWKRENTLLLSTLLTMFMGPVVIVVLSLVAFQGGGEGFDSDLMKLGMGLMIGGIMNASNYPSLIAFSYEGQKIYILKTLPIDVEHLIKCKLSFANTVSAIGSFLTSVAFCFVLGKYFWIGILTFPVLLLIGVSNNKINIYRDLKNPKLNWQNISELTNNNTRFLAPILLNMFFGMISFLIAVVITSVDTAGKIPTAAGLIIVLASSLLEGIVMYAISTSTKKVDVYKLFSEMGQ